MTKFANTTRIIFALILSLEIFALWDRGGGPLLSHLFLTGITFLILAALFLFQIRARGETETCHKAEAHDGMGAHGETEAQNEILPHFRWSLPIISYIVFFLLFSVSLTVSLVPGYGLAEFLLFANAGLLLIIFSSIKISGRDLHWFAVGLILLTTMDTLIGYFVYTQTALPRLVGTFFDLAAPHTVFGNDFADFLLLVLPLALWQLFRKHERITTTIVFIFSAAILLSGLLLGFSRGAWISAIALVIIFIIWAAITRRRNPHNHNHHEFTTKKNAAIRAVSTIILTVLLVNGLQLTRGIKFQVIPLMQKATFQADEGAASASDRIAFWKGAVEIIKDRPIFGGGVLSFKYLFPQYQENFEIRKDHPHNIFLKIAVENGVFAALAFIIFIIGTAAAVLGFLWRNPWHRVLPFMLGALGALGHHMVDYSFAVSNYTLFVMFIAFGLNFAQETDAQTVGAQAADTHATGARTGKIVYRTLMFISALLLLLGLHEALYNIDFKLGRNALGAGNLDSAITKLERTEKLFFERDRANYLARAYSEKFDETKDEQWREKELELLEKEAAKTIDATITNRLGEVYEEAGEFEKAESEFKRTLELDPQNRLRFYYNFVQNQKRQGKKLDPEIEARLRGILENYTLLARYNKHLTVLTDNPQFAMELFRYFGMDNKADELNQIWFEEFIKFSMLFGSPARVVNPL